MNARHFFIATLFLFVCLNQVLANHISAGELRYTATGKPNEYIVGLKVFRNCSGAEFCSSCPANLDGNCALSIQIRSKQASNKDSVLGNFNVLVQKEASAQDALYHCKHNPSICTNCGTRTPGTQTGIEVYYFEGKVDLSFLPTNYCDIIFSFQSCCRNQGITTLFKPELQQFYIQCDLNRCLASENNSVVFLNHPVIQACAGQNVSFNQQATDPDGDSLSYAFVPLKVSPNQAASFLTPYTYRVPFPFFGAPDTLGFGLNQLNGNLLIRPMGSFVSNFALEVSEWRKIENKYSIISHTTREFTMIGNYCPNQNPPEIVALDSNRNVLMVQTLPFRVNQNTCYFLVAKDPENDTTDFFFQAPIPLQQKGLSISVPYNVTNRSIVGPLFDSLKLCWNPSLEIKQGEPYFFKVFAADRACKPEETRTVKQLALQVTFANGLGPKLLINEEVQVYPNPAINQLFVHSNRFGLDQIQVTLFSPDGKQIQANYQQENNLLEVDLTDIESGLWILEICGENFHFNKRFFHRK